MGKGHKVERTAKGTRKGNRLSVKLPNIIQWWEIFTNTSFEEAKRAFYLYGDDRAKRIIDLKGAGAPAIQDVIYTREHHGVLRLPEGEKALPATHKLSGYEAGSGYLAPKRGFFENLLNPLKGYKPFVEGMNLGDIYGEPLYFVKDKWKTPDGKRLRGIALEDADAFWKKSYDLKTKVVDPEAMKLLDEVFDGRKLERVIAEHYNAAIDTKAGRVKLPRAKMDAWILTDESVAWFSELHGSKQINLDYTIEVAGKGKLQMRISLFFEIDIQGRTLKVTNPVQGPMRILTKAEIDELKRMGKPYRPLPHTKIRLFLAGRKMHGVTELFGGIKIPEPMVTNKLPNLLTFMTSKQTAYYLAGRSAIGAAWGAGFGALLGFSELVENFDNPDAFKKFAYGVLEAAAIGLTWDLGVAIGTRFAASEAAALAIGQIATGIGIALLVIQIGLILAEAISAPQRWDDFVFSTFIQPDRVWQTFIENKGKDNEMTVKLRGFQFALSDDKKPMDIVFAYPQREVSLKERGYNIAGKDGSIFEYGEEVLGSFDRFHWSYAHSVVEPIMRELPKLPGQMKYIQDEDIGKDSNKLAAYIAVNRDYFRPPAKKDRAQRLKWFKKRLPSLQLDPNEISPIRYVDPMAGGESARFASDELVAQIIWAAWRAIYKTTWIKVRTPEGATLYWWREYTGLEGIKMFWHEEDEKSDMPSIKPSELPRI